jgi:hypothetical protein
MSDTRSRAGILVGLAAAAAAFAAAISAATAPTARADDFTDLINDLNIDYSAGQTAFATAYTDFSSDQLVPGLAQLLGGVDDYTLSPGNTLLIGTAEVLVGDPINSTADWGLFIPASYADAVSVAQTDLTTAGADLSIAANDFSTGDYVFGTVNGLFGLEYSSIVPLEELILGAAVSF